MTMKTLLMKLAATLLLSLIAVSRLHAEPNSELQQLESNNVQLSSLQTELIEKKLDLENQQASERIRAEKEMAAKRYDAQRNMVHDLAWNSWVLFAIAILFFCYLRDKRRHETIRVMIEKGVPVTPELLDGLRKKRSPRPAYDPHGYLCWGITLTLVGVALMMIFKWDAGRAAAWIVLAIGVANLILWFVDRSFSSGGQSK